MHYKRFTIHEYRGIQQPISFNLEKDSIFPLVGVNECGKTTILEAILAFDSIADKQNNGKHLADVENLYSLKTGSPRVSAEIAISPKELRKYFENQRKEITHADWKYTAIVCEEILANKTPLDDAIELFAANVDNFLAEQQSLRRRPEEGRPKTPIEKTRLQEIQDLRTRIRDNSKIDTIVEQIEQQELESIVITRHLKKGAMNYSLEANIEVQSRMQNRVAKDIVTDLDFILYFDDFRHDVPTRIKIDRNSTNEWTQILDTLFTKAHEDLDFFSLPELDGRKRQTAIARAAKFLNKRLTAQWEKFHLEDRKSLDIHLTYHDEDSPEIELEIMERDDNDEDYFFGIKDRSKGFFWFFNFVMRLEFNPKMKAADGHIIYLLDEPGSYLHARAQDQLCQKLMDLSRTSRVFYCTHSHHLLDPSVIPFSAIRIVDKNENKQISIRTIFERDSGRRADAAFQPIYEALQVRPDAIDIGRKKIVVVEGVSDFLSFSMFKPNEDIAVVPAVNASSMKYHLSWLMAWGADYVALWDNDDAGIEHRDKAEAFFGKEEAERHYRLLPLPPKKKKQRLEDLYTREDIALLKSEMGLPDNTKFSKVVVAVYYSSGREATLAKLSNTTKDNFRAVFDSL